MRDHDKVPRSHGPAPARTPTPPAPATGLLALQNAAGNAAVVQMLRQTDHAWTQDTHHHGAGCGHRRDDQSAHAVQRAPASGSSQVAIQRVTQGHKQGEHIFNALDDLTQKCSRILQELLDEQIKLLQTNGVETGGPAYKALWEARAQADVLSEYAGTTGRARNNDAFKTASRGAPLNAQGQDQNSIDYSALSNRAKDAMALCGTTGWAGALAGLRTIEGTLPGAITDQVAHGVKRDEDLRTTDQPAFDTWFTTTGAALKDVFTALILTGTLTDAALRNSDRQALGYEPDDVLPAFSRRARAGQSAEYA
ncbi:hypothetical protein ACFZCG_17850 [Streptomyces tanashiensis]|uniref:hypothetical protein n=1 Tax=Streptomyces tanashiensis TaxID=67367 RepID=UPI0036E58DBB